MEKTEDIILFDMEGTLCDYDKALFEVMKKLKFPKEPDFDLPIHDDAPEYLKARSDLIKSSEKWWANLPKFKLGFDILKIADELGFGKRF